MTLALYGKTRKRQGGLLLAAFLAVIAASLGGLAIITSAFAHNAGLSATCAEAKVSFTSFASSGSGNGGKNEPRIDVSVDGGATTTYIASFTGSSFDWSTAIHPTGSVTIKAYWTAAQTRDGHTGSVGPQTFTVSCQSKIIVKKVTINDPGSPNLRFSATVAGPGTAGDMSGNFDTNSSLVDGLFLPDSPNDDFTVTEGSLPNANWAVTGKKILAGDVTCGSTSSGWTTSSAGTASGGELNNIGGKTTTVCFRNEYTPPVTKLLKVCKIVENNNTAPTGEGGTFGFTVSGGASASRSLTRTEGQTVLCSDAISVVQGVATTVTETGFPAGWSSASGFPKVDANADTVAQATGNSIVVTVAGASCNNGTTIELVTAVIGGADCFVTFTNKMGPVVQQNGTSTVAKTHSGDGTPSLGENFTYTITFTVAGGPLSGQKFFSDILPASLEFQGTPLGTQTDPGNYLTCTNTSTALNCNLADQTPIGVYSQVINVHVKTGATCGPVINSVKIGADTAQGDTVATDTVNVEGCGELGIEKSDSTQTVDAGANIQWTIGLRNSSVVPSTAYVYDAGATLVAPAACSQAGAGTVITCTVPASNGNSTPELLVTVKTAKPTQTGTQMCTPQDVTNTAYLVDSNTEITPGADDPSDSGKFTIPATANANCIKVKKLAAGPGDWNITFTNSGPAADINFSDTYQDGGSSTDIVSIKNSANGDVAGCTPGQPFPDGTKQVSGCNLNLPNGVTVITVHTEVPANSCNGWKVGNTVAAFMGTGSPSQGASIPGDTTEADKTASASYSGDPASCGGTITFVKDDGVVVGSNIRWKITVTSTWQIDKPAMIEDVGTTNVTATLVAGNETCVGTPTMTGDVVTCSVPANSSAYFHVETAIPPYTGANKCIPHTETNVAHLLDAGNTSGNHDANDASDSGEYVIQATADAACITASKSNGVLDADGSVHWTITFSNTGPDATVDMSDAYQQAGTATDIIAASYSGLGCNVVNADTIQDCEVLVVHGLNSATVTLRTERPAGTCGAQTVTNDLTVLYNGQNVVDSPDNGNTYVEPSDEGDCTVTLNLCKQWTIEQGEQVVDGKESFEFTVGSNGNVIISDVEENTHGDCIGLVVTVGEFGEDGLVITEDNIVGQLDLTGFVTPLVSINGGPSVPGPSVTVPLAACQEEPFLKVIDQLLSSIESLVTAGEPAAEPDCTVLFINDDTENNLPTGNIQIEKYLDINGDGDANDAGEGPIPGWEMTTTCQQSIPGADVQDTNASGIVFIPGLAEGDNCTVTEELPSGWQVTRVTVNGANFGPTTSANVTVPGSGATAYVRFFNRQLGGISVHKTTVNVRNGIETVNTNDDDGWTITVKSALCGIDLAIDTDANGNAVFSGLPLCTDYVVAEVLASGEPGYSPVTPASVSGKTPTVGGNTQVNFTNETRSFDPPCPNCTPGTQTVPTPTPTPPTPTPPPCVDCAPGTQTVPTPIPTTGGTNPSPVSTVAGEKTPGPGQTPIAPSTGEGGSGGSSGGLNLMLVLGGLGALAAGVTFMAMGRKNRS